MSSSYSFCQAFYNFVFFPHKELILNINEILGLFYEQLIGVMDWFFFFFGSNTPIRGTSTKL